MNLCGEHESEIAYESQFCPACQEIEDLKEQVEILKETIAKLEENQP